MTLSGGQRYTEAVIIPNIPGTDSNRGTSM